MMRRWGTQRRTCVTSCRAQSIDDLWARRPGVFGEVANPARKVKAQGRPPQGIGTNTAKVTHLRP